MDNNRSKIGRPTKYSHKLALEICNTIATTNKSTKQLCDENLSWPCQSILFQWIKDNYEFSKLYGQAKQCQVSLLIDEIIEIADDSSSDCIINDAGKVYYNHLALNRAKLKIDTRKWIASKLMPRVYGRNLDSGSTGEENPEFLKELLELRASLEKKYKRDY